MDVAFGLAAAGGGGNRLNIANISGALNALNGAVISKRDFFLNRPKINLEIGRRNGFKD